MDVTAIRTAAREMYGDIDSVQFSDSQLLTYINFSLQEIARRIGFVRAAATYAAMDGINTEYVGGVAVPTDFLQEIELRWNGVKLYRMRYDDLLIPGDRVELTAGPPTHYTVSPVDKTAGVRRFLFWPYVGLTQAASLQVLYLARPTTLAVGADVPKIPEDLHMAIVFYTCHMMGMAEDSLDKSTMFKRQYFEQMSNWEAYALETAYNENPQVRTDGEQALHYLDT